MTGRTIARLGRLLGVGLLVLLLAGCVRFRMDIEVSEDDMVGGTMVVAVQEDVLQFAGGSVDDLIQAASEAGSSPLEGLPKGASIDDYSEDGFVGKKVSFEAVTLTEFSADAQDQFSIERRGDEFRVSGLLDLSRSALGTPTDLGQQFGQQILESFEFTISVTFPGEVRSATGEIDGNTVTFRPKFGQTNRIEAVASAIPSKSSPLLMILLIAVGALVVGAIAFLLTHRKAPTPAAGPTDGGWTTPVEAAAPQMPGAWEPLPPGEPVPPAAPPPAAPPEDEVLPPQTSA